MQFLSDFNTVFRNEIIIYLAYTVGQERGFDEWVISDNFLKKNFKHLLSLEKPAKWPTNKTTYITRKAHFLQ